MSCFLEFPAALWPRVILTDLKRLALSIQCLAVDLKEPPVFFLKRTLAKTMWSGASSLLHVRRFGFVVDGCEKV